MLKLDFIYVHYFKVEIGVGNEPLFYFHSHTFTPIFSSNFEADKRFH